MCCQSAAFTETIRAGISIKHHAHWQVLTSPLLRLSHDCGLQPHRKLSRSSRSSSSADRMHPRHSGSWFPCCSTWTLCQSRSYFTISRSPIEPHRMSKVWAGEAVVPASSDQCLLWQVSVSPCIMPLFAWPSLKKKTTSSFAFLVRCQCCNTVPVLQPPLAHVWPRNQPVWSHICLIAAQMPLKEGQGHIWIVGKSISSLALLNVCIFTFL